MKALTRREWVQVMEEAELAIWLAREMPPSTVVQSAAEQGWLVALHEGVGRPLR
jgi:hypothetical protein